MSAPSDLPDTHTAAATTLPADDDPLTTAGTRHDTLSPTERVQRRDSLERHLQHRPDARHLKEKGILMDTSAAPGLQAAQRDLEMQQASDRLRRGLEGRSARGDLEERELFPVSRAWHVWPRLCLVLFCFCAGRGWCADGCGRGRQHIAAEFAERGAVAAAEPDGAAEADAQG